MVHHETFNAPQRGPIINRDVIQTLLGTTVATHPDRNIWPIVFFSFPQPQLFQVPLAGTRYKSKKNVLISPHEEGKWQYRKEHLI